MEIIKHGKVIVDYERVMIEGFELKDGSDGELEFFAILHSIYVLRSKLGILGKILSIFGGWRMSNV